MYTRCFSMRTSKLKFPLKKDLGHIVCPTTPCSLFIQEHDLPIKRSPKLGQWLLRVVNWRGDESLQRNTHANILMAVLLLFVGLLTHTVGCHLTGSEQVNSALIIHCNQTSVLMTRCLLPLSAACLLGTAQLDLNVQFRCAWGHPVTWGSQVWNPEHLKTQR